MLTIDLDVQNGFTNYLLSYCDALESIRQRSKEYYYLALIRYNAQ